MKNETPKLTDDMSPDAFAIHYGMHPKTVYRLCRAGKIPNYRIGRKVFIPPLDKAALIDRRAA